MKERTDSIFKGREPVPKGHGLSRGMQANASSMWETLRVVPVGWTIRGLWEAVFQDCVEIKPEDVYGTRLSNVNIFQ